MSERPPTWGLYVVLSLLAILVLIACVQDFAQYVD
jgi:hypothetical protein